MHTVILIVILLQFFQFGVALEEFVGGGNSSKTAIEQIRNLNIYDKYYNLFDLEELFFFINAPGKAGAMPRSPNSQKFLQVKKDNLGI